MNLIYIGFKVILTMTIINWFKGAQTKCVADYNILAILYFCFNEDLGVVGGGLWDYQQAITDQENANRRTA